MFEPEYETYLQEAQERFTAALHIAVEGLPLHSEEIIHLERIIDELQALVLHIEQLQRGRRTTLQGSGGSGGYPIPNFWERGG